MDFTEIYVQHGHGMRKESHKLGRKEGGRRGRVGDEGRASGKGRKEERCKKKQVGGRGGRRWTKREGK